MGDDDDIEVKAREEAEPDEIASEKSAEERKKERKIYKGEVRAAADLLGAGSKMLMIQPMSRKVPGMSTYHSLPPTFVATKFRPVLHDPNKVAMEYYDFRAGGKYFREVPKDFELNVLRGRRGEELTKQWEELRKGSFLNIAARMGVTIGADPEIFVVNKRDEVVPAWELLGSKKSPKYYTAKVGGASGSAYWDGFQAEFTTPGWHTCLYEMTNCIQGGLEAIYSAAKIQDKGYALSPKSVVAIDPDVLMRAKDEHVAFGCSPSFNAYDELPVAADGRTTTVRFAGGHLHFGMNSYKGNDAELRKFVRGLDAVLGVASVSLFGAFDNPIRRKFYGKAGEYRTPPHGLEYRVLSNAWLLHPLLCHLTFDLARAVLGTWESGFEDIWKCEQARTRAIINSNDIPEARKVLEENKEAFDSILNLIGGTYCDADARRTAYRIWSTGAENALKDPTDIEGNWKLKSGWDGDYASGRQFMYLKDKLRKGKV